MAIKKKTSKKAVKKITKKTLYKIKCRTTDADSSNRWFESCYNHDFKGRHAPFTTKVADAILEDAKTIIERENLHIEYKKVAVKK